MDIALRVLDICSTGQKTVDNMIMVKHIYNPYKHLVKNEDCLLIFSQYAPIEMKHDGKDVIKKS